MKRMTITLLFLLLGATWGEAKLNVVATYPWIADIAGRIGGEYASVQSLARGNWDPHFVAPKPSLIATVRRADLVIINGAELEIGWLPPVLRESRNARVQVGTKGFLDLSAHVDLIDVPKNVSRSEGDVHPSGNPHYHLDPRRVPALAAAIRTRLCSLDRERCGAYEKNYTAFAADWHKRCARWEQALAGLKGARVVQYHRLFNYFFARFGLTRIVEIEPLPGIPPSSGHLVRVIDTVKRQGAAFILTDVYHSREPGRLVAEKAGVRLVVLPHDVGAVPEATDIVSLFDEMVRRLAP
ncbi:MAG TPA: zinc ABC transporter substrate-binding protein [Spirochaetota bacterium]|nr:zinc ABC transporter substrate-binding protein [Spirochaetota bacterium]HOS39041.1 zinc ABC transporter substrate-binding protein [Spirochaetota bacterium]HPU88034.1 zinc ABC transporter substrate-binding protein [Spirochaetota bacterium]